MPDRILWYDEMPWGNRKASDSFCAKRSAQLVQDGDSISHLHVQPSLCTLIQNCLFGIFRKCSLRFCNIQKAIREISAQFGPEEGQVRQNLKVLMLMFQSIPSIR